MHPEATTAVLHGTITALEPPNLLVMTTHGEGNPNESLVTFRFGAVEGGNRTRIEIFHERLPEDVPTEAYDDGWSAALDSLETYVATQRRAHDGN